MKIEEIVEVEKEMTADREEEEKRRKRYKKLSPDTLKKEVTFYELLIISGK